MYIHNEPVEFVSEQEATVISIGDYYKNKYGAVSNRKIGFRFASGRIVEIAQSTLSPPRIGGRVNIELWNSRFWGQQSIYKPILK
jgi:hypothetical protein